MKRLMCLLLCVLLLASMGSMALATEAPLKISGIAMRYNPEPAKDSTFWKWLEKEFNVDYTIEWVPWDTYNAKLDLILASGEIPDVIQIGNMNYPSVQKAAVAGAFWDLGELMGEDFANYPGFKANTLASAWELNAVKGKKYLIPNTRGTININLAVRADWLKNLNLPMPTTLEEFADVVVAIGTGDPDGNGKQDTVGFVPQMYFFEDAFGLRTPVYNAEGGLVNRYFLPEYADMLAYFRDMYARGGIAKEYALIKGAQAEEMFLNGSLGVLTANLWHTFRFNDGVKKLDPNASVDNILFLKGPKGYANHRDPGYAGGHVFAKTMSEADVKRALSFFEKQTAPEYFNSMFFGVEGVHWNLVDGAPLATDLGKQEITNSAYQPLTWKMDEWSKVNSPLASVEYNKAMREKASALYDIERNISFWDIIASDTWNNEWPKIRDEFDAMQVKAVSGDITMDEFRAYQQKFLDDPIYKQAALEFAQAYTEKFPKN